MCSRSPTCGDGRSCRPFIEDLYESPTSIGVRQRCYGCNAALVARHSSDKILAERGAADIVGDAFASSPHGLLACHFNRGAESIIDRETGSENVPSSNTHPSCFYFSCTRAADPANRSRWQDNRRIYVQALSPLDLRWCSGDRETVRQTATRSRRSPSEAEHDSDDEP